MEHDVIRHHLKHMAIGAVVVLALLLAFGVDLSRALPYALLLACPLGMIGMMFFMGRGNGHGHEGHHGPNTQGHGHDRAVDAEPPVGGGLTREDHERIP
ncbi:DUF2933 domain-containing protein [Cellulomonas hominis]|uniref:DUF2933 domain-containing protein n=1 Tax=Cellulomonas hominis TaxID=156981 RepID=UPI001443D15D|nr:DUF2933 domain-containing protein [Cellulomonas hominis]NKY10829.1 DUF2933 domain-containing protein [Cellulomonas hominis]